MFILVTAVACAGGDGRSGDAGVHDMCVCDTGSDLVSAACGDGPCDLGEDCWSCPEDCECRCGDGVCTHGEFCATCPGDCDCETLAATPPMGWNSWNRFHCDITESLIRETAEAMVSSGMADAGYRYVNLDDCWQVERDASGRIVADPQRFPSGIAALADYVHGLGLRLGIYTCAGTLTCQGRPGSYGHEFLDAKTYAEWGVDLVKVDWCYTEGLSAPKRYEVFRDAIAASGRPMVHSICNWGLDSPWVWGPRTGHMWRTSMDIFDAFVSVLMNFELTVPWAGFAGTGHWNDPDMLEVGNGGLTPEEARAHMSLWAILSSPLIAGNDVRVMDEETRDILLNPEVIAVDQDPLGLQGVRLQARDDGAQVLAKPLAMPGNRAVVLFNPTEEARVVSVRFEDLGLASGPVRARDLWARRDLGTFEDEFSAEVPGHGAVMVRLIGQEPSPPEGESFVSDLPFAYAANSLGPVERDRANGGEGSADGSPLRMAGVSYARGLGVHAASRVLVHLGGRCERFFALAGLDDTATPKASVRFEVLGDGRSLVRTEVVEAGSAGVPVEVEVTGVRYLEMRVVPTGYRADGHTADWAEARIQCGSLRGAQP